MGLTSGSIPDIPGTTITSDSVRAMGTVRRLTAAAGDVTLGPAADAYLATLRGAEQAAALFSEASGGATLHQLRHSALTHDAEGGTGTPMLMARSGHTSARSLARYARVSAEALARHQAERDPARRR
jgi:integrase